MSPSEKTSAGAEVGARKINEDGEVVQEEGDMFKPDRRNIAKFIFYSMIVLSAFGLWKVGELILYIL